jgi:hypothetical protein
MAGERVRNRLSYRSDSDRDRNGTDFVDMHGVKFPSPHTLRLSAVRAAIAIRT